MPDFNNIDSIVLLEEKRQRIKKVVEVGTLNLVRTNSKSGATLCMKFKPLRFWDFTQPTKVKTASAHVPTIKNGG